MTRSSSSRLSNAALPPHQVVEDDGAVDRIGEPHHGVDTGRRRSGPVPATPVVAGLLAARALGGAHRVELLLAAVATIRLALAQQPLDVLLVQRQPFGLKPGTFVGIEPEPPEPVEDCVDRRPGRSLAIGVLDPEHEGAAMAAREQPAEQRGAGAADVQESGGTRCEPGPYVHAGIISTAVASGARKAFGAAGSAGHGGAIGGGKVGAPPRVSRGVFSNPETSLNEEGESAAEGAASGSRHRGQSISIHASGRVAQWESTVFTRRGSLVQSQPRPPIQPTGRRISAARRSRTRPRNCADLRRFVACSLPELHEEQVRPQSGRGFVRPAMAIRRIANGGIGFTYPGLCDPVPKREGFIRLPIVGRFAGESCLDALGDRR